MKEPNPIQIRASLSPKEYRETVLKLDIREVAMRLRCSESHVRRMERTGYAAPVYAERMRRIFDFDFDSWYRNGSFKPSVSPKRSARQDRRGTAPQPAASQRNGVNARPAGSPKASERDAQRPITGLDPAERREFEGIYSALIAVHLCSASARAAFLATGDPALHRFATGYRVMDAAVACKVLGSPFQCESDAAELALGEFITLLRTHGLPFRLLPDIRISPGMVQWYEVLHSKGILMRKPDDDFPPELFD